ncbi:unnamed protein product [Mycena citricolor]|uniref:Uncharacterized protein n=1 Tax=Mycena citricolor TaxID=2018698 RepID=A0AAD2Q4S5_9AGAR|nr:unnamed protein product [Mycena citricolor]CAK5276191.1 unnamed protein product [Mycena citricolor]
MLWSARCVKSRRDEWWAPSLTSAVLTMFAHLAAILSLALMFASGVSAVPCAVCPSSIVFRGVVRTLTTVRQDSGNTVQCSFNTPPIAGFSPACVFTNSFGTLTFDNTGGSCPSTTTLTTKSSC